MIIAEVIVGSQVYGTCDPLSDTDKRIITTEQPKLYLEDDIIEYNLNQWLDDLEKRDAFAVEILYTPEKYIIKQNEQFKYLKNWNFIDHNLLKSYLYYSVEFLYREGMRSSKDYKNLMNCCLFAHRANIIKKILNGDNIQKFNLILDNQEIQEFKSIRKYGYDSLHVDKYLMLITELNGL
jgi:hypothetical protein